LPELGDEGSLLETSVSIYQSVERGVIKDLIPHCGQQFTYL